MAFISLGKLFPSLQLLYLILLLRNSVLQIEYENHVYIVCHNDEQTDFPQNM